MNFALDGSRLTVSLVNTAQDLPPLLADLQDPPDAPDG
jgi:hypothetical protein